MTFWQKSVPGYNVKVNQNRDSHLWPHQNQHYHQALDRHSVSNNGQGHGWSRELNFHPSYGSSDSLNHEANYALDYKRNRDPKLAALKL